MAKEDNLRPPWQPGQSGNPKGRPKNRAKLTKIAIVGKKKAKELYGLTPDEINEWEQTIMVMTSDQLTLLAKWSETPAYPKGLAMAILYDMKNGKTTTLDKLRERQYGKPTQTIEVTGKDGAPFMPDQKITPWQAKEFIRKLEDEY